MSSSSTASGGAVPPPPAEEEKGLPTSPSPTSDSSSAALFSTLPYLSAFLLPYPLRLQHSPVTGRFIIATSAIPSSSVVFQSRAFVKGVHSSYLRRVCDTCWRYHHGRGWPLKCGKCRQVWWCSKDCMRAAQPHEAEHKAAEEEATAGEGWREWRDDDDHFTRLDHGVHVLECGTLKKLNGMKVDKDTAGMLRAIVRIHYKLQQQPPSPATSPSPALSPASVSASPAHIPTPTSYDFDVLIGHFALPLPTLATSTPLALSPPSFAFTSHQLFWVDVRHHLAKLLGQQHLPTLYSILAKLESNAFGLYAAPPDKPAEPTPPTSPSPAPSTAPSSPSPTPSPSSPTPLPAPSSTSTTADPLLSSTTPSDPSSSSPPNPPSVLPSSVDRDNLGLKSIGRSLYPSASYFNHSCEPNCEVFETGSILQVCAKEDIAEGDEVTISYIDTQQRLRDRRLALQDTYFFHCQCTRCTREEAVEEGKAEEGEDVVQPAPSYTSEARRKKSRKRNVRLKKKKLEPVYHPTTPPAAAHDTATLGLEQLRLSSS